MSIIGTSTTSASVSQMPSFWAACSFTSRQLPMLQISSSVPPMRSGVLARTAQAPPSSTLPSGTGRPFTIAYWRRNTWCDGCDV